jgi:hypothetical protein
MKRIIFAALLLAGCNSSFDSDVDKILKAKRIVLGGLNHPDTADFHDMSTEVRGNNVKLIVTAKNAFGVPSTHTFNINVP